MLNVSLFQVSGEAKERSVSPSGCEQKADGYEQAVDGGK